MAGCSVRLSFQAAMKESAVSETDEFMKQAIAQARAGLAERGIPIGSVLVRGSKLIGAGHNRRVQDGDPTAHGEIDCLRRAGRQTNYRDTIIYSTLMPCYMCAGAIVQFGIPRVVAGENKTFAGAAEFMQKHGVEVVNLDLVECYELMEEFRRLYPQVWLEDIGSS
jgi:cytosine/creatinine deaminase